MLTETFTEEIKETLEPVAPGAVRLLTPLADEIVFSPALRVAASVAAGWRVNVEVAGQRVNDSLVGEKREDNKNKITTYIFVGINLRPGPNTVKVTPVSPQGEVGQPVEITATGARPDTAFARDVFPGTSFNLVNLSRGEILQGSETLVLEVRDRRNPDIVISREPLARSVDYLLDPLTGSVFFLRPISAFDRSFNLLQVVATYEYRTTGLATAVYTARGAKRFTGIGLRVGASFVNQRQDEFGPYYVGGVDGEKDLPRGGKLFFEWGLTNGRVAAAGNLFGNTTNGADAEHNGQAYRVELFQPLGFREGTVRASYTRAGENFYNPFGGTIAPGSERGSAFISLKARPSSIVSFGFAEERNKTINVDNDRQTVSAAWTESIGERLRLTAGYDFRDFNDHVSGKEIQSSLATVGAEWHATEKLNIAARREQNLGDADPTYPNQTTVNATYQMNDTAKLFFSQRLASAAITPISDIGATGFAALGSRQETAIGVETKLNRYTSLNSNYRIENGINGTDSFAVLGLTNRLPVNQKLSLDFGFERGFHIDGAGASFNSANVGFAWQPNESFRSTARYELRDRLGFGQIVTVGAAGKLNDATSVLGRFQFARFNYAGRGNEAMNATAALAYRPLKSDRAAMLFSYTRRSFVQGAYFTISSKLSNLFNLFGTSREGLITVTEAEERGLLADNFKRGAEPTRAKAEKAEAKPARRPRQRQSPKLRQGLKPCRCNRKP